MSEAASFQDNEESEVAELRRQLSETKEDHERKLQEIKTKTKEHVTKMQEKMQSLMQQKDAQIQDLEDAKAEVMSEVSALKAQQADTASDSGEMLKMQAARAHAEQEAVSAMARVTALEGECACLKNQLQALEESKGQEVETTSSDAAAKLEEARAKAVEDAQRATARADALESECSSLKERLRVLEQSTTEAASATSSMQDDTEASALRKELEEMRLLKNAVQANLDSAVSKMEEQETAMAELQTEASQSKQELQAKMKEVVDKAKEHVKQSQARLEAQVSECKQLQTQLDVRIAENKDLTEKFREVDDAYAQQQEKLNKYKQLMAQANARIEDGDANTSELKESAAKLEEENSKLKEILNHSASASAPPSRETIVAMGGILLTVEAENDELWCLVGTGSDDSIGPRRRWWLSTELDVEDKPIPFQRRWKGEVSALRAQMARAKKRNEELQEEFDAYRKKANAALQMGASQSEENFLRERKLEQLGEQLQATKLEIDHMQIEKQKVLEDLETMRHRLQDASNQKSELERLLEVRVKEAREAGEAALTKCRTDFENERESLAQKLRDRERTLLQDLDLRRTQKESLEEEIEGLRARLANRPIFTIDPAIESESEDGRGGLRAPSSLPSRDGEVTGHALVSATPPRNGDKIGVSPLDEKVWHGLRNSPQQSPSPRSIASGEQISASVGAVSSTAQPPRINGLASESEETAPAPAEKVTTQSLPLHASLARQDIMSLRAQVRRLEAALDEQRQQFSSLRKEKESLALEVREVHQEKNLQHVVGQHQQMEYIRNVFRRFVEALPAGSAEHEQLIPVLMTFFQFGPEETKTIQGKRQQTKSQSLWGQLSSWRG